MGSMTKLWRLYWLLPRCCLGEQRWEGGAVGLLEGLGEGLPLVGLLKGLGRGCHSSGIARGVGEGLLL